MAPDVACFQRLKRRLDRTLQESGQASARFRMVQKTHIALGYLKYSSFLMRMNL